MPRICRFAFSGLALAAIPAAPASAALIMHRDLSLSVAKTIAEAAVAACAAKTYAVSAVVVDRDGETIVEMRGDDARAAHYGECAAQGLHRDDLQAADSGIRQEAARSQFGRASAGDAAECHRHSGRAADQDRQ